MNRAWLAPFTWNVIVETNRQLCAPKQALHKPTSDGYESTRELWESRHLDVMSLPEAIELCRRSHQLAPFCNFNGNTFVAVIRKAVSVIPLQPDTAVIVRSLVGHIVAGVATAEEQQVFSTILCTLPDKSAPEP